jgi:Sigma-70 factor, region 1.
MEKEIQSDELKKLITLGEEKGFLTYDDVNNILPPDVISSDQIDDIIMFLSDKNIDIIDTDKGKNIVLKKSTGESVVFLTAAPVPAATSDPVKMYLREMGFVSLLSREDEVKIAKKIEGGEREVMNAVFSVSSSIRDVIEMGEKLSRSELRVKNVVESFDSEDGFPEEEKYKEKLLKVMDEIATLNEKKDDLRRKLGKKDWEKYNKSVSS